MPVSSPQVRFGLLASAMCVAMAELPETDTATLNARAEQFEAWCARVLDHLPCMQTLTTAALLPHRCALPTSSYGASRWARGISRLCFGGAWQLRWV